MPDYTVAFEYDSEMVVFRNRERLAEREAVAFPRLDAEIYNEVRIVAPGYDPYWLEREWQEMLQRDKQDERRATIWVRSERRGGIMVAEGATLGKMVFQPDCRATRRGWTPDARSCATPPAPSAAAAPRSTR